MIMRLKVYQTKKYQGRGEGARANKKFCNKKKPYTAAGVTWEPYNFVGGKNVPDRCATSGRSTRDPRMELFKSRLL